MALEKKLRVVNKSIAAFTPGLEHGRTTMKAKNAATPLCYVEGTDKKPLGHDWQPTTSDTVRYCSRCKLVQHKTKTGHWKNAGGLKDKRKAGSDAIEQAALWQQLEDN